MTTTPPNKQQAYAPSFSATPTDRVSYTFQNATRGKARYRLDYILTLQADRRFARIVTVRSPPQERHPSGYLWVALRWFAGKGYSEDDWILVCNGFKLTQICFKNEIIAKFAPLPPNTSVAGMTAAVTETLLSTATNQAPATKRNQRPRGCGTRAASNDRSLPEILQVTTNRLKRARAAAVQILVEAYLS